MRRSFSPFAFLFSFLFYQTLSAQNVSISGALTGNGSYANLAAAFTALNSASQAGAAITLSITGNTTETVTASLTQGTWASLLILPVGARRISGNIPAALIEFNGADRVSIDGLNTNGNSLTIDNANTGLSSTISFTSDAKRDVVQNCTLLGANTNTNSATVFFSYGQGGGGNDSITFTNCTIDASVSGFPVNGICSIGDGNAGQENSSITFNSCNIANYFSATDISVGLLAGFGNTDWTISQCRFYQSAARNYTTANTHRAIQVSSGNNYLLTANTIGYASASGTGNYTMTSSVGTRFIAIDLATGTAAASSVQGNVITAISLSTSSGASTANGILCGINLTAGSVNVGTITPNTIGGISGTGLLSGISTSAGAVVAGINSSSAGTIVIRNNNIGGLFSSGTTAAIGGGVSGINVSGPAASVTISGNTIGNSTTNNMQGGTYALTTGASPVSGINLSGLPLSVLITNNTIQNLCSYGSSSIGSAYVRGIWTTAISPNAAAYTITGNTITNLSSNSTLSTVNNAAAAACGIAIASGTNDLVSNNIISNVALTNTAGNGSFAVGIAAANATNTTIAANKILNISNASTSVSATTPGIAAGIVIRSGGNTVSVINNMISLGSASSANTAFIGIQANNASLPDPQDLIYHNTINISGTVASGAQPSFCFYRGDFSTTARVASVDVRNNIFTNSRSGGTGLHFAIANNYGATVSATGWGNNASNNNVLNANPATIGCWGGSRDFSSWQLASSSDASSYSGITITYVDPISDLHLNMGTAPTVIESGAQAIPGLTTDIDGEVRPGPLAPVNGGSLLPDIGADEIDGTPLDALPPVITYSPLSFTCDSSSRTFTANITDLSGVPVSGNLQPRVYFRKNAGPYFSTQGVLSSGTSTNGTWTFTIATSFIGNLSVGDVVYYFVIAQDILTPAHTTSSPSTGLVASNVNTVTTAPGTPNSYPISGILSGVYTVGTAGNYSTLTQAVNAYNNSCLSGPVTFLLNDNLYSTAETFPVTINANVYASTVNTLTIKPTQASTVLTGNSTGAIILLNGADDVIIDGSISSVVNSVCPASAASRDLSVVNTNTSSGSAVIWLATSATGNAVTNCSVKNCLIAGDSPATTSVGLGTGGAVIATNGTNNDNISFVNNSIHSCQYGIYAAGAGPANKNQNVWIAQNSLDTPAPANLGIDGIYVVFTNGIVISGNKIDHIESSGSTDVVGINVGFTSANGISTTSTGIANAVSNVTISKNTIGVITQSNTFSAAGIALGNTGSGTSLLVNNMISGVASNGTSGDFSSGIILGGGTGSTNVFYNTVSMQGSISGATPASMPASCLAVTSSTTPVALNIRNNIFNNTQVGNTGSTVRFTAIALAFASPYTGLLSDNNDLFAAAAGPGTYATGLTDGLSTGILRNTLYDWQTEISADAASQNFSPVFVSSSDLHLVSSDPGNLAYLNAHASPLAVTGDADCENRGTLPDIGADEICAAPAFTTLTASASEICAGSSSVLSITNATLNDAATWQWYSGACGGTAAGSGTSIAISPSVTTTYFVRGEGGCVASTSCSSITITVNLLPVVTATASASSVCAGSTVNLSGSGAVNYNWMPGSLNGASVSDVPPATTSYTLTGTDANGCTGTASVLITVNPLPVVTVTASANAICAGNTVNLNGSGAVNYNWMPGSLNGASVSDTPLATTTYTLTATDANSCADTTTLTITVNPLPVLNAAASPGSVCAGSAVTLTANGASTYNWMPGFLSGASVSDVPLSSTTYTLTGTDANACVNTTTLTVLVNPLPNVALAFPTDTICQNGGNFMLSGGSPVYGTWIGTGVNGNILDPLVAGYGWDLVTYLFTDANGCFAADTESLWIDLCNNFSNSVAEQAQINIYPNPNKGSFVLSISHPASSTARIEIYSVDGKMIYIEDLRDMGEEFSKQMDLSVYDDGIYFMRITSGPEVKLLKVIKGD